MTQHQAQELLAPYFPWFLKCWETGWHDYNTQLMHPEDDPRARAVMIQNRAIIYSRQPPMGDHKLKCVDLHRVDFGSRRLIRIGDTAIVQFKKLTDQYLLINNPTKTSRDYDSQAHLEGIEDLPRLTVGYLPNEAHTDYKVHLLLTKSSKRVNWHFEIAPDGTAQIVEELPLVETPAKKSRVKPKTIGIDYTTDAAQG